MKPARGFTLTELMVTLAVLGILLAVAFPSFRDWMLKVQIRTATEAVLHGLQLSRTEAIKRNGSVTLTLSGGTGWTIADGGGIIQSRPSGEGSSSAYIAITSPSSSLPYSLSFNSLGRLTSPGVGVVIAVTGVSGSDCTSAGPTNCLVVEISTAGQIKMCDPSPAKLNTPMAC